MMNAAAIHLHHAQTRAGVLQMSALLQNYMEVLSVSEEAIVNKETTDKVLEFPSEAAADIPVLAEAAVDKDPVEVSEEAVSAPAEEAAPFTEAPQSSPEFEAAEEDYVFPDEEKPAQKFPHFRHEEKEEFSRDEWILSQLGKEHLMEYLTLEQRRTELDKQMKETREKRLFSAFQLTMSLAAVVAVVYLLRDNPTILVNILYIAGIVAGLWLWKNPKGKK